MLRYLWIFFKGILSVCLIGLLVGVSPKLLDSAQTLSDYGAWLLIAGLLVTLSAALWIDWRQPHPRLQLLGGVLVTVMFFAIAYSNFTDQAFPHDCSVRSKPLICLMENELYKLGGRGAAALPALLMGLLLSWGLYLRLKRGLNSG